MGLAVNERVDCMACLAIGDRLLDPGTFTDQGVTHAVFDGRGTAWTWRRCCFDQGGNAVVRLSAHDAINVNGTPYDARYRR